MKVVNVFKYPRSFDVQNVQSELESHEMEIAIGASVGRGDTPDPFCFYFKNLQANGIFICLSLTLVFAKNGKLF